MSKKDYYELLGISKGATKDEIKRAYKKLALQFHPDRAPEEKKKEYEEKFKEISEAASVLADDKKRQQYDQFGHGSLGSGGGAGGPGYSGFDYSDVMSQFKSGMFGDFEDIFDHLFSGGGGNRKGARGQRGDDLLYEMEISLEEATFGTKKTIPLNKLERCDACSGRGAHSFEQCHHCHGSGYLKRTQRTPFGLFQQTGPCSECQGRGEVATDSCEVCHGERVIRRKKEIEVTIPAGVEEGTRLRVRGEGGVGSHNGPSGDLYVGIRLLPHKIFVRRENDLLLTVPLSFTQAVLGDEIEVPTIDGKAMLKIPAGTQSETTFKMSSKGLPSLHGSGRGDQLVKVHIQIPTKLSKKQKDLIVQLKEEKASKSFLERIFG
ncbi:molecular chaperone DnaJ [Candidatus Woesearchaeota archaeon]|nr:molecular chaperone DnaJ [Candidatus Woesearchaeota archaeon]